MAKEEADPKTMEKVKKKLKEGWIKSRMIIEVLAISRDAAESALKKHIESMEKDEDKTIIYKKDWHEVKEVKQALGGLERAYATMVDLELITESYEKLLFLVMNYGPSNVEILEPASIKLGLGEAQGILISVADMLHKFARQKVGGIVIKS